MIRVTTALILVILLPVNCFGHSGGLDRNGGHHDRKRGGYHYHSGAFSQPRSRTPPQQSSPRSSQPARTKTRTTGRRSYRSTSRTRARGQTKKEEPSESDNSQNIATNLSTPKPKVRTNARTLPPRQTKLPRYHRVIHDSKVKILIHTSVLIEVHILEKICREEGDDEIHFYLPGADSDAPAWAVTTRTHDRYFTRIDRKRLPSTFPMDIECRVIGVTDGDTINVVFDRHQYPVRLLGIDCPELAQPFGRRAKQFTADQCFRKDVTVRIHGMDRNHRILGNVLLQPDERSLNSMLVEKGFAWHYKQMNESKVLADLQLAARRNTVGLWADPEPVAPWDW